MRVITQGLDTILWYMCIYHKIKYNIHTQWQRNKVRQKQRQRNWEIYIERQRKRKLSQLKLNERKAWGSIAPTFNKEYVSKTIWKFGHTGWHRKVDSFLINARKIWWLYLEITWCKQWTSKLLAHFKKNVIRLYYG